MGKRGSNPLFNTNRFKVGLFCTNAHSAHSLVPEVTKVRWDNMIRGARMADRFGFEAITPIARWKGQLDSRPDHKSNEIFEPFTYAAAIAQATSYSSIFSTTHAPTIHPVAIAKMAATIDHISGGRFSLNIVGGWNRREFEMFGIDLLEHDERYSYLADWLMILRRLWTGAEFNYDSKFFHLRGALARPVPVQPGGIPIMNAASSAVGTRFTAEHADIGFCMPQGDVRSWAKEVGAYKRLARDEFGREIQLWTAGMMVQKDTTTEARAFAHYSLIDNSDRDYVDSCVAMFSKENGWAADDSRLPFLRERIQYSSGYPLFGSAEDIATELEIMADAGIDGILILWVDYLDGVERFGREVLPLLEQKGLRAPFVPEKSEQQIGDFQSAPVRH